MGDRSQVAVLGSGFSYGRGGGFLRRPGLCECIGTAPALLPVGITEHRCGKQTLRLKTAAIRDPRQRTPPGLGTVVGKARDACADLARVARVGSEAQIPSSLCASDTRSAPPKARRDRRTVR